MFPLVSTLDLSSGVFLATAFGLGAAFGAVLERAGFASGCRLTAVFYGYDMAVAWGRAYCNLGTKNRRAHTVIRDIAVTALAA